MKFRIHLFSAGCAALLAGCSGSPEATVVENWLGDSSVGTIDGTAVPESLFRRMSINMLQKPAEEMTPEERSAVLNQLVDVELAARDAQRRGLHRERTIAADLELLRLQFMAQSAIERFIEENPPREAELRDLYEQQTANLSGTEYRARHILVESETEAAALIEQLDAGSDFATLAREHSTGPTGPNGGELDWFTPDRMVEPFSNAVLELEIGEHTSAPVQTRFGWHVIVLEETREQQPPGIESMRVELTTMAQRMKIQEYVEELRNSAEIVIE